MPLAAVTAHDLQVLVDTMREEGSAAATISLERAELRRLNKCCPKRFGRYFLGDQDSAGMGATLRAYPTRVFHYLSQMIATARWMAPRKIGAVLSQRVAGSG